MRSGFRKQRQLSVLPRSYGSLRSPPTKSTVRTAVTRSCSGASSLSRCGDTSRPNALLCPPGRITCRGAFSLVTRVLRRREKPRYRALNFPFTNCAQSAERKHGGLDTKHVVSRTHKARKKLRRPKCTTQT
eukprot:scaffold62_cov256-Pinguiococcus_pyrenoidosus.AAC.21